MLTGMSGGIQIGMAAGLCLVTGWLASAETFEISGAVQSSTSGSGVRGALVTLIGLPGARSAQATPQAPASLTSLTPVTGSFRFAGLSAGKYLLRVEKPGYTVYSVRDPLDIGPS